MRPRILAPALAVLVGVGTMIAPDGAAAIIDDDDFEEEETPDATEITFQIDERGVLQIGNFQELRPADQDVAIQMLFLQMSAQFRLCLSEGALIGPNLSTSEGSVYEEVVVLCGKSSPVMRACRFIEESHQMEFGGTVLQMDTIQFGCQRRDDKAPWELRDTRQITTNERGDTTKTKVDETIVVVGAPNEEGLQDRFIYGHTVTDLHDEDGELVERTIHQGNRTLGGQNQIETENVHPTYRTLDRGIRGVKIFFTGVRDVANSLMEQMRERDPFRKRSRTMEI